MNRLHDTSAGIPAGYEPRRVLFWALAGAVAVLGILVIAILGEGSRLARDARASETLLQIERQRVLTQQILNLSEDHAQRGTPASESLVRAVVTEFEERERQLGTALPGDAGPRTALDALSQRFASRARAVADAHPGSDVGEKALRELQRLGLFELPAALGTAGLRHGVDRSDGAAEIMIRNWTALAVVALVLFLEAAFVFWPAHNTVHRALSSRDRLHNAVLREKALLEDRAKQLAFVAAHDPLTGLSNRAALHEALDALLSGDAAAKRRICVLHIDLDHFKELNDGLGHATGDAALKRVAEIMRARVRAKDVVARVGGDEFVIVMTMKRDEQDKTVQDICERLIARIREPMVVNGLDITLGASIGYAFATPEAGDADTLIGNADLALYEAKRAGKGVARAFTGQMQERLSRRTALVRDIERALEMGEFVPVFQPILRLGTGEIAAIEMLMRWDHPERGEIPPEDFMDIAEEIGLVDAIEARVLLDGLDTLAALRGDGVAVPPLSINASTRTMRYSDYAERLTDAVTARGFAPAEIIVEVLETTLVEASRDQIAETVSNLRGLGFSVFVDEFGTGYSSLRNLASLEVNGLKIDPRLIADLDGPRTRQILRAIAGLAGAMALTVVADGVQDEAQAAVMDDLGADAVQGAAIAGAMPAKELAVWLELRPGATESNGAEVQASA